MLQIGQKIGGIKDGMVVLAEQPFVSNRRILERAKILRLYDRSEMILGNDACANEQIIDKLTTIKLPIRGLIIDVVFRL